MPGFHEIRYRGRTVAAVIDDEVIIGHVAPEQLPFIKAVCAYALEVLDGTAPGPYSDELAEQYATLALQAAE